MLPNYVGQTIGPYLVRGVLGQGGMGVVLRAYHTGLQKEVALKLMLGGTAQSDEARQRFVLEAQAMSRLKHPGLVELIAVGRHEQSVYYAMELVTGAPLSRVIDQLPAANLANILAQVADALQYVHESGFIHRDVKPANILINPQGRAQLMDFGVVKDTSQNQLTMAGAVIGTPAFMAPELAAGDPNIDHRIDIYALGAVLYRALAGRLPYPGDNPLNVITHVIKAPPPSPSQAAGRQVDPALEQICLKAMARNPDQRYQLMLDMVDALTQYMSHGVGDATSESGVRRLAQAATQVVPPTEAEEEEEEEESAPSRRRVAPRSSTSGRRSVSGRRGSHRGRGGEDEEDDEGASNNLPLLLSVGGAALLLLITLGVVFSSKSPPPPEAPADGEVASADEGGPVDEPPADSPSDDPPPPPEPSDPLSEHERSRADDVRAMPDTTWDELGERRAAWLSLLGDLGSRAPDALRDLAAADKADLQSRAARREQLIESLKAAREDGDEGAAQAAREELTSGRFEHYDEPTPAKEPEPPARPDPEPDPEPPARPDPEPPARPAARPGEAPSAEYAAALREAKDLFSRRDMSGARTAIDRALALDDTRAEAWDLRGVLKAQGRDLDGALADLDRAVHLDPNFVSSRVNRGMIHLIKGNDREALVDGEHLRGRGDDIGESYAIRGIARERLGAPRAREDLVVFLKQYASRRPPGEFLREEALAAVKRLDANKPPPRPGGAPPPPARGAAFADDVPPKLNLREIKVWTEGHGMGLQCTWGRKKRGSKHGRAAGRPQHLVRLARDERITSVDVQSSRGRITGLTFNTNKGKHGPYRCKVLPDPSRPNQLAMASSRMNVPPELVIQGFRGSADGEGIYRLEPLTRQR